ncbi:MAG: hypothetical protein H3C35_11155 [Bacteroidetes bacterium]|nr:hypothetical protein [Bacteroidota bacterium]
MNIFSAYFRIPAVHIAALLYFIVSLALTQIPLLNYLGYEFSAIIALVTSFASGILTIYFFSDHKTKPLTRRTWLYVVRDYLSVNAILLLIPLVIISLNAFVVKNCSFVRGLEYYFLLPFVTMIFSVSLALLIAIFFRKAKIIFIFAVILILSDILRITYTQPQLFAYNPILGFFPGITYDETLSDISRLLLYREFTAAEALLFFILFFLRIRSYQKKGSALIIREFFRFQKKERILWSGALLCALLFAAELMFSSALGFEHSEKDIQTALGRQSYSEHFIFYYSPEEFSIEQMKLLKQEAEYHFHNVTEQLQLKKEPKRISVFIYPSDSEKLRFIGTSTTNIAKPWKHQLHLTSDSFESTFRHELVHILAVEFGMPVLKASPYMVFNEGLAVAIDWHEDLYSVHQYVAALQRDTLLGDASRLFTLTGFAQLPSSYAYLAAGSFSKYIIDYYGIERYKKIFCAENFYLAYGKPLSVLLEEWKIYLNSVDVSTLSPKAIQLIFNQQTIFKKICAREIAERNEKGMDALQTADYRSADSLFALSYKEAESAAGIRGIMLSSMLQKKPSETVKIYQAIRSKSKTYPSLRLIAGDAYTALGSRNNAMKFYNGVNELRISESSIESAALRILFMKENLPDSLVFALFYNISPDSIRRNEMENLLQSFPNSVLIHFLLGRMYKKYAAEKAIAMFEFSATHSPLSELKYFSSMNIANLYYQRYEFEKAKYALWNARNYLPAKNLDKKINELFEVWDYVESNIE